MRLLCTFPELTKPAATLFLHNLTGTLETTHALIMHITHCDRLLVIEMAIDYW